VFVKLAVCGLLHDQLVAHQWWVKYSFNEERFSKFRTNQQNYQQMSKMKISAKILVKIYQQYKMFLTCVISARD